MTFPPLVLENGFPVRLPSNGALLPNQPSCRVWRATNQSILASVETNVSFSNAIFESVSDWWDSSQPDRITFPYSGIYLIGVSIRVQGGTGTAAVAYLKVDNTYVGSERLENGGSLQDFSLTSLVSVLAGQKAYLSALQAGANRNIMSIDQMSPILWATKVS